MITEQNKLTTHQQHFLEDLFIAMYMADDENLEALNDDLGYQLNMDELYESITTA